MKQHQIHFLSNDKRFYLCGKDSHRTGAFIYQKDLSRITCNGCKKVLNKERANGT